MSLDSSEPVFDLESYDVVPKRIRKLLKSGSNVMLHGAAGTGKSTILRAISKHNSNSVVLSPTGIAALNVGGQTLHSFFGFSFGYLDPVSVKGSPKNLRVLMQRPLIIIDEVSMVRSDVFEAINIALQKTLGNPRMFGGLQVLLLGDSGQLPPIVTENEAQFFPGKGKEMFFNARAYRNGKFQHVELDTIHRQTNEKFIAFLLKVRSNTIKQSDLDWFNSRVETMSTSEYFKTDTADSTVLCMTNARADDYNRRMYDKLDRKETLYIAQVSGKFNESEYPTHYELGLKPGAKVVVLRNSKKDSYVNGSVGVVSRLEPDAIYAVIKNKECKIEADVWEKYAYVATDNGVEKSVIGSFKQIPVRLAWAVTVHKSQGMTLRKFHLDLERSPFTHGQMYVALSRARALKGITMTRGILKSDIIVDSNKLMSVPEA